MEVEQGQRQVQDEVARGVRRAIGPVFRGFEAPGRRRHPRRIDARAALAEMPDRAQSSLCVVRDHDRPAEGCSERDARAVSAPLVGRTRDLGPASMTVLVSWVSPTAGSTRILALLPRATISHTSGLGPAVRLRPGSRIGATRRASRDTGPHPRPAGPIVGDDQLAVEPLMVTIEVSPGVSATFLGTARCVARPALRTRPERLSSPSWREGRLGPRKPS